MVQENILIEAPHLNKKTVKGYQTLVLKLLLLKSYLQLIHLKKNILPKHYLQFLSFKKPLSFD